MMIIKGSILLLKACLLIKLGHESHAHRSGIDSIADQCKHEVSLSAVDIGTHFSLVSVPSGDMHCDNHVSV